MHCNAMHLICKAGSEPPLRHQITMAIQHYPLEMWRTYLRICYDSLLASIIDFMLSKDRRNLN